MPDGQTPPTPPATETPPSAPPTPPSDSAPKPDATPPAPQGAPEKYADFKLPEGVKLEDADKAAFETTAKDLGLTQEQAQKFVERELSIRAAAPAAQKQQLEQITTLWTEQAKADPLIGGTDHAKHLAVAKTGMEKHASAELQDLLSKTGLGAHPEVIKHFFNLGKASSQDGFVPAPNKGDAVIPLAQRLYPKAS